MTGGCPTSRSWIPLLSSAVLNQASTRAFFPGTPSNEFWSSSPRADSQDNAWHVSFMHGFVEGSSQSSHRRVRLVRAGQ
ncbi:DUF1566 domain-containing protein [Alcanivorax sp. S71-1-4]|uniref:Lcl C-terminal domain-containing protein n=1 Tax=Alcanivorax sp. S71-1-4 TaxID=1177159 RepID=UPI003FA4947B